MSATHQNPISNRGRWRFRLRTLLIVMALMAGWFAWYVQRAERQRSVVRWVQAHGGAVHYDYQVDSNGVFQVTQPATPSWLIDLLGIDYFARVVSVDLRYVPEDIDSILALRRNRLSDPNLEQPIKPHEDMIGGVEEFPLYFPPGSFSDPEQKKPTIRSNSDSPDNLAGEVVDAFEKQRLPRGGVTQLSRLTSLKGLRFLYLSHTGVVDLTPISRLKRLEMLNLSGTSVSDIEPLSQLTRLRRLDLWMTPVSDVSALQSLHNLKSVNLRRTKVKQNDLEGLKNSLPNCQVYD